MLFLYLVFYDFLLFWRSHKFVNFRFLFDESCADYKYYEYQLGQEEKAVSESRESQASQSGSCTNIHVYLYLYFIEVVND